MPGVLVAAAQPLAVPLGIFGREDLRSDAPFLVPLVAPRRQQSDVETERVGLGNDPIHVGEVLLVRVASDRCRGAASGRRRSAP